MTTTLADREKDVTLRADIARPVAWLLQETPLSEKQSIEALPGTDWQHLTARVPDDQQTPWWMMRMGASVKVLEPAA